MARSRAATEGAAAKAGTPDEAAETLSIEEIQGRYPDEWVLVRLCSFESDVSQAHGQVLAHDRSRARISKVVIRAHQDDPSIKTYVFAGGRRPKTREEWTEVLSEAAGRGITGAGW
jgi:hypothetical protein